MSKWAVRSHKVDQIRNYIHASVNIKVRSWGLTQKAIAERLDMDRVRVNRMMTNKIDAISLEALISVAEISGLDVSIDVRDFSARSVDREQNCLRCRHQTIDSEKDKEIAQMKLHIERLELTLRDASRVLEYASRASE